MHLPRLRLRSSKPAKPAPAKAPPTLRQRITSWVIPFVLVFAIFTPIRASIADWNDVPSGSMRPTILEGDRIYVNKLAYGLRIPLTTTWLSHWDTPKRGDIVTLKSPADGIRLVKRVIGLPGDRIAMKGNQLIINGKPAGYSILAKEVPSHLSDGRAFSVTIAEEQLAREDSVPPDGIVCDDKVCSHALTLVPGAVSPSTFKEFVVPAGEYFMMGDNRTKGGDRGVIGCVPLDSIYGRCSYIALSVDPEDSYMPRFARWFTPLK